MFNPQRRTQVLQPDKSTVPQAAAGNHSRLQGRAAMWVAESAICVSYILSTLPTPLYVIYRQTFQFSQIMLTVIYAVYVVGTVTTMFFLGRLSDQIGRRPVVLISLGIAAAGAVIFICAQNIWWLFPARIFSGLGIALVSGAATAWVVELEPQNDNATATQVAIGANFLGLGLGPFLAGLLGQYAQWPLRLSYVAFLFLLVPVAVLVSRSEETLDKAKSLGEASMRPRLGVPRDVRAQFVSPAIGAFAVFAVLGFYTALAPSLLVEALHNKNHAVAGTIVAEVFFIGTLAIGLTPRLTSHRGLVVALILLLPSLALLVVAELARSMGLLLIGTAITGVATGLGYRCSVQKVNGIAPAEQRAEIVSSYLIACYCGISLPVIGVGLVSKAMGAAAADTIFAAIIATMAAGALIVEVKSW